MTDYCYNENKYYYQSVIYNIIGLIDYYCINHLKNIMNHRYKNYIR